ncbi:MAG TPA: glycosyltransferase family 4 protein [Gaiellaceae bacterium]|jgi:glycosyltransferase involved in cell wall biosynthesis
MRLVFVTQQVDPGHPALAATVPMLRALSARVDEVVVLADRALPEVLPANCRVRSFGARTQAGRGVKFESALAAELAHRPRPGAVVAHMCPIYAVLAAPLARPVGTKVLLWYTHWSVSRTLRLAERVSNVVLSVDRRTFPLDSRKVRAIGHGIDLSEFACADGEGAHAGLRAVALGRYSQAKGLDVVLRALRLALDGGLDLRLEVFGPALNPDERAHRAELERLVDELDLGSRVKLGHALLRSEVPALLARADVLVNNMRAGATDKVVYEACASCTPAIASNPAFDSLLPDELRFDREDPRALADRLVALGARSEDERRALGRTLRERVAADHSVESWADSVVEAAT